MKKIVILIFCIILIPLTSSAKSLIYINSQNNYSFSIPSGWLEISKETINTAIDNMSKQANIDSIKYTTGFQMTGKESFQHPYILIQDFKINTPSYSQIEKEMNSDSIKKENDKIAKKYSELIKGITAEKPYIDKKNNAILMTSYMTGYNNEKIKITTVIFLGKHSTTRLYIYTTDSSYSEGMLAFDTIMDSFKYKQGYQYDKEVAKKNDSPSITSGVLEKGFIGAIIGGILALLFGVVIHSKKNKQD